MTDARYINAGRTQRTPGRPENRGGFVPLGNVIGGR
jgi:hypothetical protein